MIDFESFRSITGHNKLKADHQFNHLTDKSKEMEFDLYTLWYFV